MCPRGQTFCKYDYVVAWIPKELCMGIFGRPGCETYYGIFSSGGIGVNSVSGYL